MLEDPRVNFAISDRGHQSGINHLGLQVDSDAELEALHAQLETADTAVRAQKGTTCCYAESDKYWVTDPTGIAWETFHTLKTVPVFGADSEPRATASACCAPAESESKPSTKAGCC